VESSAGEEGLQVLKGFQGPGMIRAQFQRVLEMEQSLLVVTVGLEDFSECKVLLPGTC